ncbi:aminotransferase class IV [Spongisporangium articulatum]|uniref:Aminotransferase class IV n=1 Tax=Spongisporangium articulatum TaxID=3362603 RepID=A0ABW8AS11_9ACTN
MVGLRVLVDGRDATAEELAGAAVTNYGHYTTMQVRDGAVRGLDSHFERLRRQQAELFDEPLDEARLRAWMRAAVAEQPDGQLRVTVVGPAPGEVRVLISLRPPSEPSRDALALLPVDYARPLAHVKHVGSFAQSFHAREARRRGFDDALLITPGGLVTETSIANVGFLDDAGRVVWPDAPVLRGTTWQLLDARLVATGHPAVQRPVPLADVGRHPVAFVANSTGLAPVGRIGEVGFDAAAGPVGELAALLDDVAWDRI